ncbi:MAG: PASTA domain-containing protein [Tannerellaceae bacterium]|nr:PASTA domain-containing protein [Tannerellaceae bacterium]
MKGFLDKLIKLPLWYHLVFAVVLSGVLLICTLKWLEVYTRHNEAIIVPDVKGLKVDKAAEFFRSSGLNYTVMDSVFSKEAAPGAIVEINPTAGSKVKEGRTIYVTVNALTSQMGAIPEVADLSVRQAYALLRAGGFENVETEYVDGEYKDLALRVEQFGRTLTANEMVPLNATLTLVVSNGNTEPFDEDSTALDIVEMDSIPAQPVESEEENWF